MPQRFCARLRRRPAVSAVSPRGACRGADPVPRLAVSSIPAADDVLTRRARSTDLPRVAELLQLPVDQGAQQLREGHLLAVRRNGVADGPARCSSPTSVRWSSPPGLLGCCATAASRTPRSFSGCCTSRPVAEPDPGRGARDRSATGARSTRPARHQARESVRRAQGPMLLIRRLTERRAAPAVITAGCCSVRCANTRRPSAATRRQQHVQPGVQSVRQPPFERLTKSR